MSIKPPLVLDTDFISSFAWIDRLDILEKMYANNMIVIDEVMFELRRVQHLYDRLGKCIARGSIKRHFVLASDPEAQYLAHMLDSGKYGTGESVCMAYLKYNQGTLGSNNLKDVKDFCVRNDIKLITTADVICEACNRDIVDDVEAETIWSQMLSKKRKLPAQSFSEYLSMIGGSDREEGR